VLTGHEAQRRQRGVRNHPPFVRKPRAEAVAEKMWCVPQLDEQYLKRMEGVLKLDLARAGTALAPGKIARRDYEYVRQGTANVFA
jgi:hypothetical protein